MTKQDYNGWTNYETWAVKLWMDNDEGSQNHWSEQAEQAIEHAKVTPSANYRMTGVEPFTDDERAVLALEKQLDAEHQEMLPELEGFAADLLNAAMSEVNWHEIAQSLVEAAKANLPVSS
jgi:hypothetical protein